MKDIAVVGAVLTVQSPVTGVAVFSGSPSGKIRAGGQFTYLDGVQITVSAGATDGICTTSAPAIGNLPATAIKVSDLNAGKKVLRVDDEVTISAIPGLLSGGGACTLNVTSKITNSGQAKVGAN